MNIAEQIAAVKKIVEEYYEENSEWCGLSNLNENEKFHIINIGTSILCTKWKVGFEGGGFVQRFVNNDLMGAIGSADSTTIKGLKFFANMVYNVGKPSFLYEYENA